MLNPYFQHKRFRIFRALVFIGAGLSGFIPLIHGIAMFGWQQMIKQSGMLYYLIEGAFLILGALFYMVCMCLDFIYNRYENSNSLINRQSFLKNNFQANLIYTAPLISSFIF